MKLGAFGQKIVLLYWSCNVCFYFFQFFREFSDFKNWSYWTISLRMNIREIKNRPLEIRSKTFVKICTTSQQLTLNPSFESKSKRRDLCGWRSWLSWLRMGLDGTGWKKDVARADHGPWYRIFHLTLLLTIPGMYASISKSVVTKFN